MWGGREGGPRLSPPWATALVLEKTLLHPCERKASAWRHTSCPYAALPVWAVPMPPEQAKTQIQNKVQADQKGPAQPGVL